MGWATMPSGKTQSCVQFLGISRADESGNVFTQRKAYYGYPRYNPSNEIS